MCFSSTRSQWQLRRIFGITGIPLAIGLHQFAQKKITRKGVAAPETALDADAFFRELAPYCTYPAAVPTDGPVEIVQEFA